MRLKWGTMQRLTLAIGFATGAFIYSSASFAADFSIINGFAALPTHTQFFVAVSILLTVYFSLINFNRFAVAHGPEILTTWGILGCFFGVSVGLYEFSTNDVSASVPRLLEGLRTAFWASLVGVGGALCIKARHALSWAPIPQSGNAKAASLDDLVAVANKVQKGLIGDDEGTLLGQLKLMRQDQRDGFGKLVDSFNAFAEKVADNNSKALIEALKEVIRDFNAKINEQFGENFKQLNAAVERLVEWQRQYKDELEAIKAAQQQTAGDMSIASTAFRTLVDGAGAYTRSAQQLETLLKAIEVEVQRGLEMERALHASMTEIAKVAPVFSEKTAALLEDIRNGTSAVKGEFEAIGKNLAASLQSSQAEMRRMVAESLVEAQSQLSSHLKSLSEETKNQVIVLDKALDAELNKALETLGQQLSALSQKFVQDYTPLTNRLREVVQLSRGV